MKIDEVNVEQRNKKMKHLGTRSCLRYNQLTDEDDELVEEDCELNDGLTKEIDEEIEGELKDKYAFSAGACIKSKI